MTEGNAANVTFKATVNDLILILPDEGDFTDVLDQVEKKLESSGKFFKGASLSIKYRGRKLSDSEERRIVELLVQKTGVEVKSFEEDLTDYARNPEEDQEASPGKHKMKLLFFKGIQEGMTKFYRGTVRSGQLIQSDGNLVVIGDVNPGSELVANGNVVVMGSLRGIVHAGADGNKEAVVVALNLQPTQLRIADVITRPPDEKEPRGSYIPEMAYIKEDTVYIDRFLPQYK